MSEVTSKPSADRGGGLLRAAALVCLLESLALAVLAVIELGTLDSDRLVAGVTTTVFFVLYAAVLAFAAVGLARARSWARAPLMLSQLIQLGVAWSFHGPGTELVAALLAAGAIFVIVVLVLPTTTLALYGEKGTDGPARHA